MRFLGIGEDGDLADMYYRLARAGHEVRMHVESCAGHGIYAGMVDRTPDWRADLPWIRDAGAEGVIIFESVGRGDLQDRLRREGFQVIGGSAFGDRLECDRVFGQEQLARCELPIARTASPHSVPRCNSCAPTRRGISSRPMARTTCVPVTTSVK